MIKGRPSGLDEGSGAQQSKRYFNNKNEDNSLACQKICTSGVDRHIPVATSETHYLPT